MPTTTERLASLGITMQQAHDWVFSHLNDPQTICDVARNFGITNSMLGEIAGGFSATQVQSFFMMRGIDSSVLDMGGMTGSHMVMSSTLSGLSGLIALDTNTTGALSVAAIQTRVTAVTGESAYAAAFNPANFAGAADGTFSATDLGFSGLGDLPATSETLQSLLYGTLIHVMRAIDLTEISQLQSFVQSHATSFSTDPQGTLSQLLTLLGSILETPARLPAFSESMTADAAVAAGTAFVQLMGQAGANHSLFDGLAGGFLG